MSDIQNDVNALLAEIGPVPDLSLSAAQIAQMRAELREANLLAYNRAAALVRVCIRSNMHELARQHAKSAKELASTVAAIDEMSDEELFAGDLPEE